MYYLIFLTTLSLTTLPENFSPSESDMMLQFQRSIATTNWSEAIKYCSKSLQTKADEYDSPETFFQDTLPIDAIKAMPEFRFSSRHSMGGQVIRYTCSVELNDPNYQYPLRWPLSLLKEESHWVVDFPAKPLAIWKKHAVLKSKLANERRSFDQNACREGFDVHLVPLTDRFVIGKPMLFRVEIKNITDQTLGYINTSYMVNNPMMIEDSTGTTAPSLAGSCQTMANPEFAEPGEVIILAEQYDVRSQYHITQPGTYRFQFRGRPDLKPSNIIEMDVEFGPLSALEEIIEALMPVIPEGWGLSRRQESADNFIETNDTLINDVVWIFLIGDRDGKTINNSVSIAVFLQPSDSTTPQIELKSSHSNLEYWGRSPWGPIFGKSYNAEQLWPDYKIQILSTLENKR